MASTTQLDNFQVEVFFDGDCPLCIREVGFLRRRDKHGRIQFTDIADPGFDPTTAGRTLDELMAEIHARLPDGSLIKGVEVFRRLYSAIGFGPVVALTRLPVVSPALDFAYQVFAKNRMRFTGRCKDNVCKLT